MNMKKQENDLFCKQQAYASHIQRQVTIPTWFPHVVIHQRKCSLREETSLYKYLKKKKKARLT